MGLTGSGFFVFVMIMSVATVAGCFVGWNRWSRPAWRWAYRVVCVVLVQVTAVAVVAVAINDSWGFYGTWSELLGHTAAVTSAAPVRPGLLDNQISLQTQAGYRTGHGTVLTIDIPGARSKVGTFPAVVYLPPKYGDPTQTQVRYPVVELYGGYPGNAANWRHQLNVATIMDSAITKGSSYPFILVAPTINVGLPRDTECVNVVHGPQVETYLTVDVRAAVIAQFRAQTDPGHWAGMGYSLGGYCALDFALRHPNLYSAAVSISGYDRPAHDHTTGELFGHSSRLRDSYTPLWRLGHVAQPPVSMLVMTSKQDRHAYREDRAFAKLVHSPARMWTLWTKRGGHNAQFWRSLEPTAFAWLSQRMSGPLAPAPTLDRQAPRLVVNHAISTRNGMRSVPRKASHHAAAIAPTTHR